MSDDKVYHIVLGDSDIDDDVPVCLCSTPPERYHVTECVCRWCHRVYEADGYWPNEWYCSKECEGKEIEYRKSIKRMLISSCITSLCSIIISVVAIIYKITYRKV